MPGSIAFPALVPIAVPVRVLDDRDDWAVSGTLSALAALCRDAVVGSVEVPVLSNACAVEDGACGFAVERCILRFVQGLADFDELRFHVHHQVWFRRYVESGRPAKGDESTADRGVFPAAKVFPPRRFVAVRDNLWQEQVRG